MKKEKDRLSIITLAVAKSYTKKAISALSEVVRYIGVTTTEISDGSTTNPITIDGSSVTAVSGDTVFYEGSAYTFDGTKWQETISFAEVITEIETITGEIGDLTALTTLVKSSIVAAINELNEKKANLSVVAALFDASVSYAVGDYCVKDGLFYKCTTAHTGAWDANDFQAVTVGNEIDANATDINGIKNGSTINNFAGVENALSNKQNKLTAGNYIAIENDGTIKVTQGIGVYDVYSYKIEGRISGTIYWTNVIKYKNGIQQSSNTYYNMEAITPINIDDRLTLQYVRDGVSWHVTLLVDSNEHQAGEDITWKYNVTQDFTETFNVSQDSSTDLATKGDIEAAISSAYHHAGTKTCAELVAGLLVAANEGNVYNMTDSGTTTSDFIEGAGQPIKAGDNVGVAKVSDGVYKFDLLSGFVDTTNFVQKSQTAGLLKNDGTVNDEIEGDVSTLKSGLTDLSDHVDGSATTYPYADVITVSDAVPANLADCSVKVEPVQDLHGQSAPYVGGASKNKLPLVLADIKAFNTTGTWSGNVYTAGGGTIEILTDSDDNIIGFKVNGTFTSTVSFTLWAKALAPYPFSNTQYIMNGCPSGGEQASVYKMDIIYRKNAIDNVLLLDVGSGSLATDFSVLDNNAVNVNARIVVYAGTVSNKIFYPMLRLATETDSTFAPYTNICPISGHTEAVVTDSGNDVWTGDDSYTIASAGHVIPNTTIALPAGTYTLDFEASNPSNVFEFEVFKGNSVDWSNRLFDKVFTAKTRNIVEFTLTEASTNLRLYTNNGSGASISNVRLYSTVQTYTLALGDTIYGGTVDFDSGVMTVTHKYVDLDTITWYYSSGDKRFYAWLNTGKRTNPGNVANIICDRYRTVSWYDYVNLDGVCASAYLDAVYIGIRDLRYDNVSDFTTALDGAQLVYELATPLTVQLTPKQIQLLQGTNTLYASTGQISVVVDGVSGSIGAVQTQANATDNALAQLAADIAEQLPDAPTTDGAYVLTVTVADGTPTYSWESAE